MKPSERINRTYELKRTTAELLLDSGPVQAPITVNLELSPRPRLILGYEFASSDAAASNELNSIGEVRVRLNNGREIDTVVGNRWRLGGGKMTNILIPKSEPVTVHDDQTLLSRCKFVLVNFPSMFGDKDIKRFPDPTDTSRSWIYQRFQLAANPLVHQRHRSRFANGGALQSDTARRLSDHARRNHNQGRWKYILPDRPS